jgi:hypothetical protein
MSAFLSTEMPNQPNGCQQKIVMPGLVPALHVLTAKQALKKAVDALGKAGHDRQEPS